MITVLKNSLFTINQDSKAKHEIQKCERITVLQLYQNFIIYLYIYYRNRTQGTHTVKNKKCKKMKVNWHRETE